MGVAAVAGAALLSLPAVVWLLTVLRGIGRRETATAAGELPSLLILVPAHDEEQLIAECVRSLVALEYPRDWRRIVVIADNCRDATAALARDAGAEALERDDPARPGKPSALAWALDTLPVSEFDAVIIVDADTVVVPGFARAFAAFAPLEDIAIQGYFGMSNEWDNWLTRLAGLLARARYEHVYPTRERARLNVPLTGNGMCLGRTLFSTGGWDAFSLSEDLELYARLTAEGVSVRYAPGARLYSQEASTLGQGRTQRERWARGRLDVLRTWAGPLLSSRRIGWLQKLDTLLELALPSPVIRLAIAVLALLVAGLVPFAGRAWLAAGAALFVAPDVLAILRALAGHPQPLRTITAFAMLPPYALWRVGVAVRSLLGARQTTWRKTARNARR